MQEQSFFSIPIEELRNLIKQAIKEEVTGLVDQQQYEPLIKTEEACKLLGVTKVTLLDWRKKGLVPFLKLNSRVYYKRSELLAALENAPNRKGRRRSGNK